MVFFAVVLHLVWGTCILVDAAATNATAVHAVYQYVHPPIALALTFYTVAILAAIGLATKSPWIVLLLLPQQLILMMSASGAIDAMWLAQFADGVIRPRSFLIADQLYSVLLAVGHTIAISLHAKRLVG